MQIVKLPKLGRPQLTLRELLVIYSFRWTFFYNLLLFLVLRVLLKRQLPAASVYVLLSAALWVGSTATLEPSWHWVAAILIYVLQLWLMLRVGVLSAIVATFAWYCVCFPLTIDMSAWHAQSTLLALAPVVLLAGFGFYTSLAGRSIFSDEVTAQ